MNKLTLPSNVKIVNQFGEESMVRLKMEIANTANLLKLDIVTNDAELAEVSAIAKKCNDGIKNISEIRKSYTRKLDEEKKSIMAQEKDLVAPLTYTLSRIKTMQEFYIARRKEKEEAARKEAEAHLRHQEEMTQKIIEMQEQGFDVSEGVKDLAESANEPLSAETIEALTPIQGTKTRTYWDYAISDINKVPREYLTIDHAKVKAAVQSMKKTGMHISNAKIDGIEIFEKTIAVIS